MIRKNKHGFYESSILGKLGVFHGFSDRHAGDILQPSDLTKLLSVFSLSLDKTICCAQVHGGIVQVVTGEDRGKEIPNCDGLVFKNDFSGPIALRLRTADCVPIIGIDLDAQVIGVAHAGWKGTLAGISKALISSMISVGAKAKNIYVALGPHIGLCCYDVEEERAQVFQKQFGTDEKISARIAGVWHVDLGYANYQTLSETGIATAHIDWSLTCTSCQVSDFFSYRKDTKETFGEQMAIIGFL